MALPINKISIFFTQTKLFFLKKIIKVSKYINDAARKRMESHYLSVFNKGYALFERTGAYSHDAYLALINLYCITNGKFNETEHKKIVLNNFVKKTNEISNGVLGRLDEVVYKKIDDILNKDGYIHFDKKVSKEIISRLSEYALKNGARTPPHYDKKVTYDPDHPNAEIYRFDPSDLVNNEDIQSLIMDPTLISIARNYLQCEPIFDFPAMWWSTSLLKEASAEAAQLYHFDLDRIKWLKIFVYLNDVTPNNGPHCYVKGSHIPGSKPTELLNRGYKRIPDEDLTEYYKKEDFIEVCAEAGAIFAGDTKCWHKGKSLSAGHRLVFELQYTNSLFGANLPRLEIKNGSSVFREFCKKHPVYTSSIYFND